MTQYNESYLRGYETVKSAYVSEKGTASIVDIARESNANEKHKVLAPA
jgi:hypothetical protein